MDRNILAVGAGKPVVLVGDLPDLYWSTGPLGPDVALPALLLCVL